MTDRVEVDGAQVDPAAVSSVRVETTRDVRFLASGLAALLLGVVVPTVAIALGVPFLTVVPLGIGAFLLSAVGLALWLRSAVVILVVETAEETHRERLDDPERGERLADRLSR